MDEINLGCREQVHGSVIVPETPQNGASIELSTKFHKYSPSPTTFDSTKDLACPIVAFLASDLPKKTVCPSGVKFN
jgi:hypothetical protein